MVNNKRARTMSKRARMIRRRKKRGEGEAAASKNSKEDEAKKEENLSSHSKHIKRLNTQTKYIEKDMLSKNHWYMR